MKWNFIQSVGIEIEGGYNVKRTDLVPDGSIKPEYFRDSVCVGEYVSVPFSSCDEVIEAIKNNWPTEVNHKCGFHIHTSFKYIGLYSQLMREVFYKHFLKSIEEWATEYHCTNPLFWQRIKGEMKGYCAKAFRAEQQVAAKTKDAGRENDIRATHLNYCFGLHKTLENRLAPSFLHSETAISYSVAYFKCIEDYLTKSNAEEKPQRMELVEVNNPAALQSENTIYIKPFKFKAQPFSLFSTDNVYHGNLIEKPKRGRKPKATVTEGLDVDWAKLLEVKDEELKKIPYVNEVIKQIPVYGELPEKQIPVYEDLVPDDDEDNDEDKF